MDAEGQLYALIYAFIQGTWASADFGICWGLETNYSWILKLVKFGGGGSQNYTLIFYFTGIFSPNLHAIQGRLSCPPEEYHKDLGVNIVCLPGNSSISSLVYGNLCPWAKNLKDPYSLVFISYYWYVCRRINRKEANNLEKSTNCSFFVAEKSCGTPIKTKNISKALLDVLTSNQSH